MMLNTQCYCVESRISEHMKNAFLDFEWTVAPDYVWQDWLDDAGQRVELRLRGRASLSSSAAVERAWMRRQSEGPVGPVLCAVRGAEGRRYFPMQRETAALFRNFAALDYRNLGSIRDFACKYGQLGLPSVRQSTIRNSRTKKARYHTPHGESHLDWAREICLMSEGLHLATGHGGFERLRRLKALSDRHLQHVQARLVFDAVEEPRLLLEPLTLIAAMWLQFAVDLTGEKEFVKCKFCGELFEQSTEVTGFRSHRVFCRDACKTKDYRRRKRTATRLAREGRSIAEIAGKLGTPTATVTGWVGNVTAERRREGR